MIQQTSDYRNSQLIKPIVTRKDKTGVVDISAACTAVTDLTLAAPQIVNCGREGADEHRVRPGNELPVRSPQLQV